MILQIMNIGSGTTTCELLKGTEVINFIAKTEHPAGGRGHSGNTVWNQEQGLTAEVDLSNSDVTEAMKHQPRVQICEYVALFASEGDPLGKTSAVKHTIRTEGPPIQQPLHQLPTSLRSSVHNEVLKTLHQCIIRPSSSPW